MHTVAIKRFELKSDKTGAGNEIIGKFEVEMNGFRLADCALMRLADGKLVAFPPRGFRTRGNRAPFHFVDPELSAAFVERAVATWRALTGDTKIVAAG